MDPVRDVEGFRGLRYLCIDLKSFYASVECIDRGLDPFTTRLVVADPERSNTTICLAATPALRAMGVSNRGRIYEIPEGIDYIMARPRMRRYMEVSAEIYGIYLRRIAPEDIHVYSIDECFLDAGPYLKFSGLDARSLAAELMADVVRETGIFATAGVGENLFLAKVALDLYAKKSPDGIACLDAPTFREHVWFHRPITDIWNVGPGIARRLARYGISDLAGVAAADPAAMRREFGKNGELLVDHAWGLEPCTMADIHAYAPRERSLTHGQILPRAYTPDEARTVLRETVFATACELVEKHLVCGRVALTVNLVPLERALAAREDGSPHAPGTVQIVHMGEDDVPAPKVSVRMGPGGTGLGPAGRAGGADGSGATARPRRSAPGGDPSGSSGGEGPTSASASAGTSRRTKGGLDGYEDWPARGMSKTLPSPTSSEERLRAAFEELYDLCLVPGWAVRKISLCFERIQDADDRPLDLLDLMDETAAEETKTEGDKLAAAAAIRQRFGKNALLTASSLTAEGTSAERNAQVGGHRA